MTESQNPNELFFKHKIQVWKPVNNTPNWNVKRPGDELLLFLCETKLAILFFFLSELIKLGLNYLLDHYMFVINITQGVPLIADFSGN